MNSVKINTISTNEELITFFDNWYNGNYPINMYGIESERIDYVLGLISSNSNLEINNILDHGCGQASWTYLLKKHFCEAAITGVDISPNGIMIAKSHYPEYDFIQADLQDIPVPNDTYDFVFSYHVLDAVFDFEKSISEIYRLLKPGGVLLIIMPCANENSFEHNVVKSINNSIINTKDGYIRYSTSYSGNLRRITSDETINKLSNYNLLLENEFYSDQKYGAIEWISKSSYSFIKEFFDFSNAVNAKEKFKLICLYIIFLMLRSLTLLDNVKYISVYKKIKKTGNLFYSTIYILKPLCIVFGKVLRLLSTYEWKFYKHKKNGSGQYMIFKKG